MTGKTLVVPTLADFFFFNSGSTLVYFVIPTAN